MRRLVVVVLGVVAVILPAGPARASQLPDFSKREVASALRTWAVDVYAAEGSSLPAAPVARWCRHPSRGHWNGCAVSVRFAHEGLTAVHLFPHCYTSRHVAKNQLLYGDGQRTWDRATIRVRSKRAAAKGSAARRGDYGGLVCEYDYRVIGLGG